MEFQQIVQQLLQDLETIKIESESNLTGNQAAGRRLRVALGKLKVQIPKIRKASLEFKL